MSYYFICYYYLQFFTSETAITVILLYIGALWDYHDTPLVAAWLARMEHVAHHDEVHSVLAEIGDLKTNTMDASAFLKANARDGRESTQLQ